eukprot:CAMPEP_0197867698 /NCGR_PEP_ID=MMETSP1438-20131217/44892_1 /TAXON_ID=1461541 /ORGANISM="Pterosperma sp., Strain CCMP1384" /LENGTH=107 /DNA_ID=CAMNT_0043486359 /DNA_START=930 /DNA_END=1253 /DNA_ORIENTATION=+
MLPKPPHDLLRSPVPVHVRRAPYHKVLLNPHLFECMKEGSAPQLVMSPCSAQANHSSSALQDLSEPNQQSTVERSTPAWVDHDISRGSTPVPGSQEGPTTIQNSITV